MLTRDINGADGARFLKTGPFLVLLKSNGRLQATWHGKAASLVFQPYAFAFVVFRILSVICSLTHALSQSLAHAQQFFSASTPGQILAPRVCTLVLFILYLGIFLFLDLAFSVV